MAGDSRPRRFRSETAPAGNLCSNVLDLSKFLICLLSDGQSPGGAIMAPKTLKLMITPRKDVDGEPQEFGIGFHVQQLGGHRKIGHGGAVYGFSTQLEALPEHKLGVVAVAALDGSNGVVGRIADYALRLLLARKEGKPFPDYRMTAPIPPERAKALVGTYRNGKSMARVTQLNGQVHLHRGVFRNELRVTSDDGTIVTDDVFGFGSIITRTENGNLIIDNKTYFGWQAALFYADLTTHLDYNSVWNTRAWDVANIWMIDIGNLAAILLPPTVIWKPRRLSIALTILVAMIAAQAWSFSIIAYGMKFSHEQTGYWLWCVALTVLLLARLVPFRWRFVPLMHGTVPETRREAMSQ